MKKFLQNRGAPFAALLAVAAISLQAHAETDPLPPQRNAGGVSYVSGGIGEGEAQRFEAASKQYPLVVQLFENDGKRNEYTAEAVVKIADPRGRVVLEEKADGPYMLVRLPAGDYRIGASLNGRSLAERHVHVTASGHAKATFVFPRNTG